MILLEAIASVTEEITTAVDTGSVTKLTTDFIFHIVEFVVIFALIVLAVFLGAKLRKATDALKAKKEAANAAQSEEDK